MNIHDNYPVNNNVSFTAMKKSQFSGIDFSVVEKLKAPIERFNTIEDFQNWAGGKYHELIKSDFGGLSDAVANQRHSMSKEWNYMLSDGDKFSPAERLLIFNGISKDLKPNDNTYMPAYNRIVLDKTMSEVHDKLSADKKSLFNFGEMYKANMKDYYAKEITEDYTGWVIIPSRINDRENFDTNVRKLQSISGAHWCTKSTHAKPYLAEGDFHIYFENGSPKIAMRFDNDVVVEFQGESNDDRLVPKYFNILEKYVEKNDLCLKDKAEKEFDISKNHRNLMKDLYAKIGNAIEEKDYEKIFNYMNIKTKKDDKGRFILSHYSIPRGIDLKTIGVNEEEMLMTVSKIEGNADFTRSNSFGNIEYIGGNANFAGMTLEDLGKIREIGGKADFNYSKVNRMGSLQKIGGDLNLDYSDIGDFYPLKLVGGNIKANGTNVPDSQIKMLKLGI